MTNFDHFAKPITHFASEPTAETPEPEAEAHPQPSILQFASGS